MTIPRPLGDFDDPVCAIQNLGVLPFSCPHLILSEAFNQFQWKCCVKCDFFFRFKKKVQEAVQNYELQEGKIEINWLQE